MIMESGRCRRPRGRPSPGRRLRASWWLVWTLLFSTAGVSLGEGTAGPDAGTPNAPTAPKFTIEHIDVQGLRHASASMVIREGRLQEGMAYGERELRAAVDRIRRLPFLRDARFALRRGSQRGLYTLVVEIEELHRFFLGDGIVVTATSDDLVLDGGSPGETFLQAAPLVGARFFPGRYDMVFASLGGGRGFQVGYQRYGLTRRGGVLSVAAGYSSCCPTRVFDLGIDPSFSTWNEEDGATELTVDLTMPLVGDHALRFQVGRRESRGGSRRNARPEPDAVGSGLFALFTFDDLARDRLELLWDYVTIDDPVFPTRGMTLSAGIDAEALRADQAVLVVGAASGDTVDLPTMRAHQVRAKLAVEQHWPVGRGHAWSVAVRVAAGRAQVENVTVASAIAADGAAVLGSIAKERLDVWTGSVGAGFAANLFPERLARRDGDLRWENRLTWAIDGTSIDIPGLVDLETVELESSLAFRNAWGLFRITFRMVHLGGL